MGCRMKKWVTPGARLIIAVTFLVQLQPLGNNRALFAGVSIAQPVDAPGKVQYLLLAKGDGWEPLNNAGNTDTRQKAMQEPARAGRDEWQSLGGQDPSLQKPFNPPRSTIKTDGTVAPTPAQNTPPQVTISGADPAVLKKNGLAIAFAPGSRAAERIQVSRVRTFPPIRGTAAELKAYKGLQRISDVWEIKEPPGAAEPFEIELRFDPSAARGKDLMLLAVSDGRVWTPSVLAAGPDYVIAESEHFSTWFVVVSTIALAALVGVAWQAKSFTNNEATPWRLIEPGHPKIKEFIQKNNLSLPSFPPDTQRVNLKNYNKVFKEREDTHFNRVVHLTGKRGSEVLNESKVACWDLTTLFASILYTLDPSIGPRIRMVKGTAGGNSTLLD